MNEENSKIDARWARTRRRLLEGGRKAFAKTGVEAATVLEIVREAGVSQPSFYNHFDSKDALAREIAADFFRRDRAVKQAVFDRIDDPALAIAINIADTLSIAREDPVIAWALIKSESLRELVISNQQDPLVAMLTAGADKGRFCVTNARTIALVIRGAALAMVSDLLNGRAAGNTVTEFQQLVLQMLGLSPDESSRIVARAGEERSAGQEQVA